MRQTRKGSRSYPKNFIYQRGTFEQNEVWAGQGQFEALGLTERVENCSKSLLLYLHAVPVINLRVNRRVIIPDDMDSVS
jgi:hypothetical protein